MPKGIRKSHTIASPNADDKQVVIPIGADVFPGTSTRLPEGVKVRSAHGVQLEFMYAGVRRYETVRGAPTVAHVLAVAEKRSRIVQLIGLGSFDYQKEFPDSTKVKLAASRAENDFYRKNMTLGEAMDEWLKVTIPTVGPNGAKDYEKDVRQLKASPASAFGFPAGSHNIGKALAEVPVNDLTDVQMSNFRT